MKISYTYLWLSLVLLAASCTYTQKVKDGTFAHDRKQYAVAVDMLKKEHQKAKTRSEKNKLAYLLADSYQQLGKPAQIVTAIVAFAILGKITDWLIVAAARPFLRWEDRFAGYAVT